ncbi:hypothetical protein SLA2020_181090 [Shorea laevis]
MECLIFVSFILLLLLLLPSSNSISFQVPSFTPSPNYILYQGSAMPSLGIMELTDNIEPYNLGLVIYANKVLIWDSNSRKLSDFACHYSFSIDMLSSMGSDGIVFPCPCRISNPTQLLWWLPWPIQCHYQIFLLKHDHLGGMQHSP